MKRQIQIFDTTLRDGEQSPGFSMNVKEKLRLALQLEKLGVDVIEAGFPISSEGDFRAVKEIAAAIERTTVAGLCRARNADIDRAWDALRYAKKPRIHTFIATSDIHMEHKLRKNRSEVLSDAVNAVSHAKQYCDDIEFSAEDATRSDPDFLFEIFEAVISAGATVINVPDTVGYGLPWEFGKLIADIRARVPNIDKAVISAHCHNDLGFGVANSIMAVQNGAGQVECTINGIGERAGNAALEEIVMAMRVRHLEFECDTRVKQEELYPTSQMLTRITGVGVQPNKAIVGDNAFAHEAGIHQDGMLKNPLTYEIMTPQSVGVPENKLVLGKHSGRNALNERLKHLGFDFSRDELNKVYEGFIRIADEKKVVLDEDLVTLSTNGVTELGNRFVQQDMQRYLNKY
jgi:2-isopropylmalate synthase